MLKARTMIAATSVSLLPCLLVASEPEPPDFTEAHRLIDTWLEAQRDYDRLPGISVGIVRDQELLWSKGYGMADTERKAEEPRRAPATHSYRSMAVDLTYDRPRRAS